ncbi:MAG: response regulator [Anaerolineae bacterium]|nr:response regulator [Anaerolineae bacterium]
MSAAKILVVDDEPGVRYFIAETLQDNGCEIITAESGEMALDLIRGQVFEVAILDLKMGQVGGLEVLATLRKASPETSVVVLTGYGSMETALEALRQGASDYLLKPCDPTQLRASVRTGLDKFRQAHLQRRSMQFASDVSHQLRNPITNLGLNLELLEYVNPEKQTRYLDVIKQEIDQLGHMVDDILALSRLDRKSGEWIFKPEDLNLLIIQIVAAHQARADAVGLDLIFVPEEGLPSVWGVRNYLCQIIDNLLSNAIAYTPTGHVYVRTSLDVEHRPNRRYVCLQVQDTGIGISEEDRARLFERFFRGKRASTLGIPGNGLGLAIVKEMVALHQGDIAVESEVGEGSTFRLWLPLAEEH